MQEHEVINLLKDLVSIPSVNPEHTRDEAVSGERRLAEFTAEYLEERGFDISWDIVEPDRPSIVASYGPESPSRTLLMESHLDTVGVEGMISPPFEPITRDGRLYGRGACDTKGPMAAAMCALKRPLLDRIAEAGGRIVFVGAMGEEKGNIGAERLVEKGLRADDAIILEPTDLATVNGHKGILWFRLTVSGISAHGSNPERGRNAIQGMGQVIDLLQRQIARKRQDCANTEMGLPTMNIGFIEGGTAVNIVPDRCAIDVDRRTVVGESNKRIMEEIRGILDPLTDRGIIRSFGFDMIKEGVPFRTSPESVIIERLKKACRECGVDSRVETAAWYSDAGAFSRTCSNVIVFGPGSIRQAHTHDEFIELDELLKGHEIISVYLKRYAEDLAGSK